jgi:NAD(P)-dependent dehydrogenase (short-subunit alcohol dehydrogenase family)
LEGKSALITGGTSGIGEAAVEMFATEGCRVLFTGRDEEKADAVCKRLASWADVRFVRADVRRDDDCRRAVDAAESTFGPIEILFNNAGIVLSGTVEETTDEAWQLTVDTNITGTFLMSRAAIPSMRNGGGGVIVNNASDWGIVGGARAVAYCASKGAVVLMTKAMALDHARENIRVNAICPGDTYVDRWRKESELDEEEFTARLEQNARTIPMGRVGRAHEIASAVLFLASNQASYMTGQCLVVDGGNTAGGASGSLP